MWHGILLGLHLKVTDRGNLSDQPFTKSHGFCTFFRRTPTWMLSGCVFSVRKCRDGLSRIVQTAIILLLCFPNGQSGRTAFFHKGPPILSNSMPFWCLVQIPFLSPKLPGNLGKSMIILAGTKKWVYLGLIAGY